MTLVITVHDDTMRDYLVDHPPNATVKDLRRALSDVVQRDVASLFSGTEAIPDSAPLGRGRVRHGCLIGTTPVASSAPSPSGGSPLVAITSGPGAGQSAALIGSTLLGRSPDAALELPDPTVARQHAVLRALPEARQASGTDGPVALLHPGSGTVGTSLARNLTEDVPLTLGDSFRLGDTVLEVRQPLTDDPRGVRPTSVSQEGNEWQPTDEVRFPASRSDPRPLSIPVTSLVSALVLGAGWALVLGARGALLAGLSAASLLVAFGVEAALRTVRRRGRRRREVEEEAGRRKREADRAVLAATHLRASQPDAWTLLAEAEHDALGDRPAATRPKQLRVRLGCYQERARWFGGGSAAPYDVPAVVDLAERPELRISGPLSRRSSLAGWVVTQLAAMSRTQGFALEISDEASRTLGSRWTRLLCPFSGPGDASRAHARSPIVSVDVDAPPAGSGSIVIRLEPRPPSADGSVLVTCARGARAVGTISQPPESPTRSVVLDLPTADFFERCARLLCSDTLLGRPPSWEDLARESLGIAPVTPEGVAQMWDRPVQGCLAVLGIDNAGAPWVLDLVESGPHLLVGGTTGSGKSQFLRTLVLSLSAIHPPDALQFALLDFKGGAAFAELGELPHVRQVATDLDDDWAHRALASLGDELRQRERTLAAAQASSFEELANKPACTPMSRLVVVIDEFATLRDSHPDLLDGFVDLARRGRSLGLHLVMATQRPGGAVSREIAANVGMRIAFRTATPEDSSDVVGAPDAAALPPDVPGAAVIRASGGPPARVQATLITRSSGTVEVRPWSWDTLAPLETSAPLASTPDSAHEALLDAIREASSVRPAPQASPLWSDPLPASVALTDLPVDRDRTHAHDEDRPHGSDGWGLRIGLRQPLSGPRHESYRLPAGPGRHVALFGSARSGRTNALRVAAAAADGAHGTGLEILVLDFCGDASDLEHLTACRAYVGPEELERADTLLEILSETGRTADLDARRAVGSLLLVDGWDVLMQQHGSTPLPEKLIGVLRHARRTRLGAVLATGQAPLDSRTAALVGSRLALPLHDGVAYAALGLPSSRATRHLTAGRALVVGSSDEVQLALQPPLAHRRANRTDEDSGADTDTSAAAAPDPRLGRVPIRVDFDDLERLSAEDPSESSVIVLGVAGAGRPVRLPLAPGAPATLVTGPKRAGRTHALALIERQLCQRGIPVHRLGPATPDPSGSAWPGLADSLEPGSVVLVDDLDRLDGPQGAVAADLIQGRRSGVATVVSAEIDAVARAFRSPLTDARQCPHVLVLAPRTTRDLDPWGIGSPVYGPWPPGRGVLSTGNETSILQVAYLSSPPASR